MKPKSNVWMYGVVLACVIMMVILSLGCLQKESEETVLPTPATDKGELVMIPEEFIIYQDYIEAIGGKPGIRDIGTIEATVISITKTEVCPDKIEPFAPEPTECSIEPYPKDSGIVRIDKIINYTPYSEQPVEQLEQQSPSGEEPSEEGTTPGYRGNGYKGEDLPKPKLPEYEPLQEGQEVSTHFLLTARPAKVRYAPTLESEPSPHGPMESAQSKDIVSGQNISHKSEPGEKIFKPIPKDGSYYVFTTKYGFPEAIEKNLPGLKVGSKFRAEIWYDGSLYVEEYEVIA